MSQKSLGEQNYEQFADRYAQVVVNKPHNAFYDRPAVLSMMPYLRNKQVLDAGCGPGIYTQMLLEEGAEVVAVDVTPAFIQITRELVGERAVVLQADLQQPLTFAKDRSFDVIVCALTLDYIEHWTPVFKEFQRVLKRGGMLVFSAGHPMRNWLLCQEAGLSSSSYFHATPYTLLWKGFGKPYPEITTYRRPLAAMLNPLVEAGLLLDRILEPLPTEEYRHADPQGYAYLMNQPSLIVVRALKP
jgi:ubiquinone/menaquinone biosynthesis C-methylase UbiE